MYAFLLKQSNSNVNILEIRFQYEVEISSNKTSNYSENMKEFLDHAVCPFIKGKDHD